MARGRLRIYLGAAPGVGKTYAMLCEGHRRQGRGTDVVVGFAETYGRPRTEELLNGLEIIPRRTLTYRGATFTELDPDAVLDRDPKVALIDELAHTNVPGSRHEKRWQDIEEILDAGIDVISTVNIQHLESVNDVVEHITGVPQRETVPDEVVRRAEQVELVDMTAEALRRRMAHGNVYPPEKIDAALSNYFREGNLTALRELALFWLADKVDEQLDRYRAEHEITKTWEARERVVVALTGGREGDTLIRRAARIAEHAKGADLLGVHVTRSDGLSDANPANLARQRRLIESLGGTYHQVVGADIPSALLDFAQGVNATQLVLGASRRGRLAQMFSRGVGVSTTAKSGPIDVHMVTHEEVRHEKWLPTLTPAVGWRRRLGGFALAAVGLPVLTALLAPAHADVPLTSDVLLFLLLVVGVALAGGFWPAMVAAVGGFVLLRYYFIPPLHTWTISAPNALALIVFVVVGLAVSAVVDRAARRTQEAAHARAEAEILSTLSGSVIRGAHALPALLARLRETFGLTSVTLLERSADTPHTPDEQHDPHAWHVVESVGEPPSPSPDAGDNHIAIDDDLCLAVRGPTLPAADQRILEAFANRAAVALRQRRLTEQAEQTRPLVEANRVRTSLLAAVSHDLRTPLASATAAVESLRDVAARDEHERAELLDTVHESLRRLHQLVANLLDMSRLQAGTLGVARQSLALGEAVPRSVDVLGPDSRDRVQTRIPEPLPDIVADPGLLERVLVNLMSNALRYTPPDKPVLVTASALANHVEVRVIDRGPDIRPSDYEKIFLAFERVGERDNHSGAGLGLALARGLTEAMNGSLTPEETPGGGLTMILAFPVAAREEERGAESARAAPVR